MLDLVSIYFIEGVLVSLRAHSGASSGILSTNYANFVDIEARIGLVNTVDSLCNSKDSSVLSLPITEYTFTCITPELARYVSLIKTSPGVLDVCEIMVKGHTRYVRGE